ncbi:MAG: hypothetical protein OEZ02_09495 [Anaerolineae bacterium]|nr:hypothetical protein [Anaerolineae bacterium]
MKKRIIIYIFGIAALIYSVSKFISIPLNIVFLIDYQKDCLTRERNARYWNCTSPQEVDLITVHLPGGDVWAVDKERLIHFSMNSKQEFDKHQNITLSTGDIFRRYLGACPTNQLWLTSYDVIDGETIPVLFSYDLLPGILSIPSIQDDIPQRFPLWYCISSQDGELILWNSSNIGKYDGQIWEPMSSDFPNGEVILGVDEDRQGNLWVLTRNGLLLMKPPKSTGWNQISKIENIYEDWQSSVQLKIEVGEDYLWIVEGNSLFQFSHGVDLGQLGLVYESQTGSTLKGIFEDAYKNVWLFWDDDIVIFMPEIASGTRVEFPLQDDYNYINSSAFDPVRGRVYIATGRGIYYLEITSD